jgi:hypothetical protein
LVQGLEWYARKHGYPSPCGRVPGGDDHDEEKEILILSSHMDRKSVWEDTMKEKEKEKEKEDRR